MASEGGSGIFTVLIFLAIAAVGIGGDERQVILESIDSKMHTHAADDVQGIRGWY